MCARSGAECLPRVVEQSGQRRRTRARRMAPVSEAPRLDGPSFVDAPVTPSETPPVDQPESDWDQLGASSSAVDFATSMFHDAGGPPTSGDISKIPGHDVPGPSPTMRQWTLRTMSLLPSDLMEACLEAYFEYVHWFILLMHEATFVARARELLARDRWSEADRGPALVLLMVVAQGLQCAAHNPDWKGHIMLSRESLQPETLVDALIREVNSHTMELLDDCSIETVQVFILLGTWHIYHGSPRLAWSLIGLAVRSGYALFPFRGTIERSSTQVEHEVHRRVWNHLIVADTFAAMIYGRSASLDTKAMPFHRLRELDGETLATSELTVDITSMTFHELKVSLYTIIRDALDHFRALRMHRPSSSEAYIHLVESIQQVQSKLEAWRLRVPAAFNSSQVLLEGLGSDTRAVRHIVLQADTLLLTYDSAVIFVNRPLLEHHKEASGVPANVRRQHGPGLRTAFERTLNAALRISRHRVSTFNLEFCSSFLLMNFFTAGAILCFPPMLWPLSDASQKAKSGALRIVSESRKMRGVSRIAEHTESTLTSLLRHSLQQEIEKGLNDDVLNFSRAQGNDDTISIPDGHQNFTSSVTMSDAVVPLLQTQPTMGIEVTGGTQPTSQASDIQTAPADAQPYPSDGLALHILSELDDAMVDFGQG
ncbi:hypothetical protein F66182_4152 [Fusarium sp. NRRL 66182]|nr:hypothetical protein F66182_4152 [Fusarium sp. NRRL 66182]